MPWNGPFYCNRLYRIWPARQTGRIFNGGRTIERIGHPAGARLIQSAGLESESGALIQSAGLESESGAALRSEMFGGKLSKKNLVSVKKAK